ncbi:MAG TPA: FG-GAP-like repeat-containing protein [Saprospiraceae bacterium]|nr:FG-GAP-like repeat-containing protein [Saprospiraceae bacterium]
MRLLYVLMILASSGIGSAQIFTKVTDSPLSTIKGDSRSVNWVDVNGDGYVDCFISNGPQAGQNNMLYINDTNGNFTSVADDPIVMDMMPSDGATFADIDNDGDLDGFVVNWYNKNNLAYINDGTGKFTQVLEGIWVNHFGYSETAAFGDYDNDGLVDLYVTNSAGTKKNFLYKNLGGNNMELVTGISPVTDLFSSRNVSWSDIDSDGDLDLYVTNENGEKENLYRNNGGGSFEKMTDLIITTDGFNTMSSSWGDIDNDGDLDLFLANDGSKNQLFRNEGNFVFTRVLTTDVSKVNAKSFSSAWADIDNDGDLDLFVTNAFQNGQRLKNNLYLNDGTGHLTEVTNEVVVMDEGWSYGCAFGDYDNDGFQDLAVATTRFGNVDEADYLYHNNGNSNHWLMVSLEGNVSNKSAIGAKIRVKAIVNGTAVWQMREISAQSAYCSQNDMRAHFGLADATLVDSMVIEWPSGIRQYRTGVLPNQILDIEEDLVNAVREALPSFGFKVFPNPTNSVIQMEAQFSESLKVLMVEVFGDTGQVIYKTTFSNVSGHWQHQIDLRKFQLTPGQYIVRVGNGLSAEERKIIYVY